MTPNICCIPMLLLPGQTQFAEKLRIHSDGIRRQVIDARFGARGTEKYCDMPTRSLPLTIDTAPPETRCFALTLIDYDAVGAVGVCWVHWLVCNFTEYELPENASSEWRDRLTQGVNTWNSPLLGNHALPVEKSSVYGGMVPPDRPHRYDLTVYALSDFLPLQNGFTWNRLLAETGSRLLAAATVSGIYAC